MLAKIAGTPNPKEEVLELITALNMESFQHTRIGNYFKGGLSGGERKRTAIAQQLISNPQVILMDEPTTGLDSKSAFDVIQILRCLADNGRTVLCVVH